ncbi:MAG: tRNA 2-thiouridine(34) synthase MnmA [Candidatus Saccharimonadales bacterium]
MSKHVYVGLSGGVDSSVTAAIMLEQGYQVTGVYMKNWSKDLPGFECPWKEDYEDAMRVAVQLGIPFKMYDFEEEYRSRVVDYMIDGYQQGLTPNPDIMCNQEIKFKLFLDTALADGADMIATGHYARVLHDENGASLHMANDARKDQTYFLYRVQEDALAKTLMPIGDFATKQAVRDKAEALGLATSKKKDSQGICFVGKVGIKEFLLHELGEQPNGVVRDQNGVRVGEHDGAIFYTIGQRQGLGIGGGLPYYVTGKNMDKNEVYVTTNIQDDKLWTETINLTALHWIQEPPEESKTYMMRSRHGAALLPATIELGGTNGQIRLKLDNAVRANTPGQSVVLYDGDLVIGGGIVV